MGRCECLQSHLKGKKKIVFGGLWTSVCIVGPALSAIAEGYDVYVITDACGDVSKEAHEMAINRMIQAGVKTNDIYSIPAGTST